MLKLKLQNFGHLMQRTDSFEKIVMLGKIEGGRRKGWQRMRWFDGITNSVGIVWVNSGSWWWTGRPDMLQSKWSQRVRHDWATELTDWSHHQNSKYRTCGLHPYLSVQCLPSLLPYYVFTWLCFIINSSTSKITMLVEKSKIPVQGSANQIQVIHLKQRTFSCHLELYAIVCNFQSLKIFFPEK